MDESCYASESNECVALCCSVFKCVALCCSVLQCLTHASHVTHLKAMGVLQCVAVCCSVLHMQIKACI